MTTPTHILYSNFTEIGCQKVGKKCVVLLTKVCKMRFFGAILAPFGGRHKTFPGGACYVILRLAVKFRPNRFRFAGVIPEK